MNTGIMQTTIPAVSCAVCNRLHRANTNGYILIVGRVFRPGEKQGQQNKHLGDENNPLVLCRREECILKGLGEERLA